MAKKKGKKRPSLTKAEKQRRKAIREARRAGKQADPVRITSPETSPIAPQPSPSQHPWPKARSSNTPWPDYRFLNPYNFVRALPKPRIPKRDAQAALLGRCPPPPHDRYVGLTGRITCRLTTVTPLFISDSHDVRVTSFADENGKTREHHSYRFFRVGGKDAIPATSLRGMVRSVFAAVTNSCFGVFTPDERLDYRQVDVARQMLAAIVIRVPEHAEDRGEVALCEDARVPAYTDSPKIDTTAWECGDKGYTVVSKSGKTALKWVVKERFVYAADGSPVTEGWLKITGRTIPGKKHERLFYYPKGVEKAPKVSFDWQRMQDYNNILDEQITDKTRQFHTKFQHRKLNVGDLVYVRLSDDKQAVEDISLVKMPRLKFRKALEEMLPEHLHTCTGYDALCPACRTFGWVKGAHRRGSQIDERKERVAYAGRVRFSFGELVKDAGVYKDEMPLVILSTPKPTAALFYLLEGAPEKANGKPPEGDQDAAYVDGYKLRGRKFYRHHGKQLNRQEFERAGRKQDHQNRSVRGVRAPRNVFEFTIDFENLAAVELGALLWSLDLDGQGHHRLGYGKPLGFGSARIDIECVDLINWNHRVETAMLRKGWQTASVEERIAYRASYTDTVKRVYDRSLRQLPHWQELIALLDEPAALPVHYPRTGVNPDPAGKNFEWFEENTGRRQKDPDPHHALDLVLDDKKGLPLLRPQSKKR